MLAGTSLIVIVVFLALFLTRVTRFPPIAQPFTVSAAVALPFFGLFQIFLNQFGFDRDGFRSLILLPVNRAQTLLAKNISLCPFIFGIGISFLLLILFLTGFSFFLLLTGFLQMIAAYLLLALVGNLVSIVAPYRIEPGSMRQNKMSSTQILISFVAHLLFPLLVAPVLLGPFFGLVAESLRIAPAHWVNLGVSAIVCALTVGLYAFTLPPLARLLASRERQILLKVTREVE